MRYKHFGEYFVLLLLDGRTHSAAAYAPVVGNLLNSCLVVAELLLGRVALGCYGGKGISGVSRKGAIRA